MNAIIGIDPDSKKHGVAIFINNKLKEVCALHTPELIERALALIDLCEIVFSIENTKHTNAVYARNQQKGFNFSEVIKKQCKIANSVGRCQQAQEELIKWLDYHSIKYSLHNPNKANWASTMTEKQFKKEFEWKGRAGSDKRSAAFFGYLEMQKLKYRV